MIAYPQVLARLLPMLNASTAADLTGWTENEIFELISEANERLASYGLFARRSSEITVLADSAGYVLPENLLSVISITLNGTRLIPANTEELEALSQTWPVDSGTPTRYLVDFGTTRLYPTPTTTGTLRMVFFEAPYASTSGTHRGPTVLADWLLFATLTEARGKRGEGQALDIAAAAKGRTQLIGSVIVDYWGVSK